MSQHTIFETTFTAFAFLSQILLISNFAAFRWKPRLQQQWGWIIYAAALIALPLGILFWVNGQAWYWWLAFMLYTIWAVFGFVVDILRPINWRIPIRWPIFLPYLILYIATQFAFWIPLWFVWPGFWILYAVLYIFNTVLNISTHSRPDPSSVR